MNFSLELIILSLPVTSKQPHKFVQRLMSHHVYCAKQRNILAPKFHDVFFLKSSSEGPPRREEPPVHKPQDGS